MVGAMDCGGCSRPIHEGRPACLYCGWAPSAFASSAEGGLLTPPVEPPREFRTGASLVRFGFWAISCSIAAWICLDRRILWPWLSVAGLVLGPLAFLAYVARAWRVRVTVDPERGLILSAGRVVPWEAIDEVGIRGVRLQPDLWLYEGILELVNNIPVVVGIGVMSLLTMALRAVLGLLLLASAVVSGLLLPMAVLLSPWQPRVVLTLRDGSRRVWRDLRGELDFVRAVGEGLRRRR